MCIFSTSGYFFAAGLFFFDSGGGMFLLAFFYPSCRAGEIGNGVVVVENFAT